MKLKVFGVNLNGVYRCIVAATSQAEAARLMGTTLTNVRTYGSQTWNEAEVELAMREPGVVWRKLQQLRTQDGWERAA